MNRWTDPAQFDLWDTTVPLRREDMANELPATARELVEVIGLDATIDLVKMYCGDELKIPDVVDGTSRIWDVLVEVVGREAAAKLVYRFAGTRIYVPFCEAVLRRERNREIIRDYTAGVAFDVLRRRHRLSRSALFRVLKMPL